MTAHLVYDRAVLNGLEVKAECLLLEPLSLQLLLTRSLCAAWYHGHPEIEIIGQLHNTVVRFCANIIT
jgi:vacuolar protein sorting-associated protein 13A/C